MGLDKYVSDQFKVPALKASPFSRISYQPMLEPIIGEINPLLSVAAGLATRR